MPETAIIVDDLPEEILPIEAPPSSPLRDLERSLRPMLDPEIRSDLFHQAITDYQDAQNDRSEWESRIGEWDDQYYGVTGEKDYPWPGASNLYVPLTMLGIETMKPRLIEAVLGGPLLATPVEGTDTERAERVELFLNWQKDTELNLPELVADSAHRFLNPGTVVSHQYWEIQRRKRKFIRTFPTSVPIQDVMTSVLGPQPPEEMHGDGPMRWKGTLPSTPEGGPPLEFSLEIAVDKKQLHVKVEREELIEKPAIRPVDPLDFYVPSNGGSDVQKLPWCAEKFYMTEQDIRRNVLLGVFTKEAADKLLKTIEPPGQDTSEPAQDIRDKRAEAEGTEVEPASDALASSFPILRVCRTYDVDEDGWDEEILYWVSQQLPDDVLGWDYLDNVFAHGMRPYAIGRYLPIPGRFYGLSFPEVVRNLQEEINTIHNQRVDAGTLANLPWYFYRGGSTHQPIGYKLRPGEGIPIDNPQQDVMIPRWQTNPSFGANEESLDYQYFERLTGLTDLALGRQPSRVGATRTATGVASLLNESGLRFKTAMEAFQRFWTEIFDQILALDQQYLPPGKEFRVTGKLPEFVRLGSRTEIGGKYDLRLTATTEMMNKQVQREDAMTLFQLASSPALIQLGLVGLKGISRSLKAVYRAYGQDPDLYMESTIDDQVVLDPNEELAMMVSGNAVRPNPSENIPTHLQAHLLQRRQPAVLEALGPTGVKLLDKHVMETLQLYQLQQVAQSMPGGAPPGSGQAENARIGREAGMQGVGYPPQGGMASPAPGPSPGGQGSMGMGGA